jgi:magnesium chelatase subunit D
VLGLLTGAYERRRRVGLVTFGGDGAQVVLSPTSSVEVAGNRLGQLTTGGATPLAAGLQQALELARRALDDRTDALLAVLTDGRATGPGGFDAACEVATTIARSPVAALVLDCETGPRPLGLAGRLGRAMGARHVPVTDLAPAGLTGLVDATIRRTGRPAGPT